MRTMRMAAAGLGAFLVLSACGREPAPSPGPDSTSPAAARSGGTTAPPGPPSELFNQAFAVGHAVHRGASRLVFEPRLIGRLRLPSGRLVACDPFACEKARPFARQLPAGEFPVYLAIANADGEERVAFAKVAFSDEPAVAWENARVAGKSPAPEAAGDVFGYGVDTGTGAFMDLHAWQAYEERMRREPQDFGDFVQAQFQGNASRTAEWLVLPMGRGSVALFSSGYGDGGYASYWGYDRHGRIAALLTDFQVLDTAAPEAAP